MFSLDGSGSINPLSRQLISATSTSITFLNYSEKNHCAMATLPKYLTDSECLWMAARSSLLPPVRNCMQPFQTCPAFSVPGKSTSLYVLNTVQNIAPASRSGLKDSSTVHPYILGTRLSTTLLPISKHTKRTARNIGFVQTPT